MEKLEIEFPRELLERIDRTLDLFDVKTREEFVLCAVERLLDHCEGLDIQTRL